MATECPADGIVDGSPASSEVAETFGAAVDVAHPVVLAASFFEETSAVFAEPARQRGVVQGEPGP